MRITFKRINGKYVVVVNERIVYCESSKEAWKLIFDLKKSA
jgi:hypothetical protein